MERLEKNAIEILHMMCERSECIICDSGGKDSSVLKHIALQAKEKYGLQFRVRHNHTTVDAPETVYFVREEKRKFEQMGIPYEIHYPKENKWSTGLKVFKWWMEDDNMDGQLAFDMEGAIYEEYT